MKIATLLLMMTLVFVSTAGAEAKIETIGAFNNESLASALQEKGIRVLDQDKPLCEIWFRKTVPVSTASDQASALYRQLKESTFIGVITFPSATKDYRGLMIQPGTYAMRYGLQPADGNHMGTAPSRDFLVLTPIDAESDPSAILSYNQLMDAARKASGGSHPRALYLAAAEDVTTTPKVVATDAGDLLLVVQLTTTEGATFPLALVVKGVSESL